MRIENAHALYVVHTTRITWLSFSIYSNSFNQTALISKISENVKSNRNIAERERPLRELSFLTKKIIIIIFKPNVCILTIYSYLESSLNDRSQHFISKIKLSRNTGFNGRVMAKR